MSTSPALVNTNVGAGRAVTSRGIPKRHNAVSAARVLFGVVRTATSAPNADGGCQKGSDRWLMIFRTRERDDGNFELALDVEGIDYLEQGLAELRYMDSGEALGSPSISEGGVSEFMLKKVREDEQGEWEVKNDAQRIEDAGGMVNVGPECFALCDGSVLSYRGENYVPQKPTLRVRLYNWWVGLKNRRR